MKQKIYMYVYCTQMCVCVCTRYAYYFVFNINTANFKFYHEDRFVFQLFTGHDNQLNTKRHVTKLKINNNIREADRKYAHLIP